MQVRRLEHYNIRTAKFTETVRFYVDVLGMRAAPPPGLPADAPPSWIYDASGTPAVHLIGVDPTDPEASYAAKSGFRRGLNEQVAPTFSGSGAIDHIAFECADFDAALARVTALGLPFAQNEVAAIQLRQIFLQDPNGITLELNFRN